MSVQKMLARYDIHPRKKLGQSFLEDLNIIRRIVALAKPAGDEPIVEIGAGLGIMTEELAKRAGRVIAIEVDPRLAAILRERFTGQDRVEVVQMDVLKYDFPPACPWEVSRSSAISPTIFLLRSFFVCSTFVGRSRR